MTRWERVLKRVIDILGSIILLVLFLPIMALCALLIKLQDGGPIFHRRRVIGPDGEFDAFKLRTMCPQADAILQQDASLQREFEVNSKLRSDPRITPVGAATARLVGSFAQPSRGSRVTGKFRGGRKFPLNSVCKWTCSTCRTGRCAWTAKFCCEHRW